MARSYGKIPRGGKREQPAPPAEIRIRIPGRHTLEQLSLDLQRAVARLQEHNVYGVQNFRIQLQPLDQDGKPIGLWTEDGNPVEVINIPEPKPEPPYRAE